MAKVFEFSALSLASFRWFKSSLYQFENLNKTTSGDTIYYHCVVKVCSIDDESTCATTQLKTTDPTSCEAQDQFLISTQAATVHSYQTGVRGVRYGS